MKIEIDIDLESIIIEALKKKQVADIEIPPRKVSAPTSPTTITTSGRYYTAKERAIAWEFGPKSGQRRTTEEIAMHAVERKHGRVLTPEEKGKARALIQIDETAENKAKEDTIRKARIDKLAAEGMAAASKELEAERLDQAPESGPKVEIELVERRDPNSINGNGYAQRAEDKNDNITRVQEGMDKHDIEATIPKADTIETESLFHD